MPYTQAVLLETLRLGTPIPATSRAAKEDTVVNGQEIPKVKSKTAAFFHDCFHDNWNGLKRHVQRVIPIDFIPQDALFIVNIYAINRSTLLWDDPLTFRPERFLDEDGNIVNADKLLPFGYGND